MCVCELTATLNLSQSTISHHIHKLKQAGLIYGVKKGKFTYYQIDKNIEKKYMI
jgi:ArsR family transcriptional regulator